VTAPSGGDAAGPVTGELLSVEDLRVTFNRRGRRPVLAVDGVNLSIGVGQTVGMVGESGCGKSVTSLALLGLLPRRGVEVSGSVRLGSRELLALGRREMSGVRGREIAMVFQDPMTSLNPVLTVGRQLAEVLQRHFAAPTARARRESVGLLRKVGIPDPERRARQFPHQLSGGMRQRAMIAMALACQPKLLIADEPTTALDVTIQAQMLELLRALVVDSQTALLLISHDLGVVAGLCETVHVMYAGRIVESAPRHQLFARPRHPYTVGLLASVPRLDQPRGNPLRPISGSPRDVVPWAGGCAFSPRCPNRVDACVGAPPPLEPVEEGPGWPGHHQVRCVNRVPPPKIAAAEEPARWGPGDG